MNKIQWFYYKIKRSNLKLFLDKLQQPDEMHGFQVKGIYFRGNKVEITATRECSYLFVQNEIEKLEEKLK